MLYGRVGVDRGRLWNTVWGCCSVVADEAENTSGCGEGLYFLDEAGMLPPELGWEGSEVWLLMGNRRLL